MGLVANSDECMCIDMWIDMRIIMGIDVSDAIRIIEESRLAV